MEGLGGFVVRFWYTNHLSLKFIFYRFRAFYSGSKWVRSSVFFKKSEVDFDLSSLKMINNFVLRNFRKWEVDDHVMIWI